MLEASPTTTKDTAQTSDAAQPVHEDVQCEWQYCNTEGVIPAPKNGHSMVVHNNAVYCYGGYNGTELFPDFSVYIPATKTWAPLPASTVTPARSLHTAVVYKNKMVVFGGEGRKEVQNSIFSFATKPPMTREQIIYSDLIEFDFEKQKWAKIEAVGKIPPARDGHSAVLYKDSMYVFGGSNDVAVFNDFYRFDFERREWFAEKTPAARERRLHTAIVFGTKMWIFGGYNGKTCFNDLWTYDFETREWASVDSHGSPAALYGHTAVVDNERPFMYTYGGYGSGLGYRGDAYQLDLETLRWSKLVPSASKPAARRRHTAVMMMSNRMLIFGGASQTYLNDVWMLDLEDPSEKAPKDTLIQDLSALLDNTDYADVTFVVGEERIKAHKAILAARSPYFDRMFKAGFSEASGSDVVIPDVSVPIFKKLLGYIYTGKASIVDAEDSLEFLVFSDRYFLPHLKYHCETLLMENLTPENVLSILSATENAGCPRLVRQCLAMASAHTASIVQKPEFKLLAPDTILKIMQHFKSN